MWYQYKNKAVNLTKIDLVRTSENNYSANKYEIEFVLFPNENTVATFCFDDESQRDRTFKNICDLLNFQK